MIYLTNLKWDFSSRVLFWGWGFCLDCYFFLSWFYGCICFGFLKYEKGMARHNEWMNQ